MISILDFCFAACFIGAAWLMRQAGYTECQTRYGLAPTYLDGGDLDYPFSTVVLSNYFAIVTWQCMLIKSAWAFEIVDVMLFVTSTVLGCALWFGYDENQRKNIVDSNSDRRRLNEEIAYGEENGIHLSHSVDK